MLIWVIEDAEGVSIVMLTILNLEIIAWSNNIAEEVCDIIEKNSLLPDT